MNIIVGSILMIIGAFGTVGTFFTISNDRGYTYNPPFTNHEITMLTMFAISIIVLLGGILTVIFSVIKNRNANKLKELTSIQINSHISGKCPKCSLNVSDDCAVCPRCGEKLK